MAKLKLDRSVNLSLSGGETLSVPSDELWVGNYGLQGESNLEINGVAYYARSAGSLPITGQLKLGGGATLKVEGGAAAKRLTFTGVAFKIVN